MTSLGAAGCPCDTENDMQRKKLWMRRRALARRDALEPDERRRKSSAVCAQLSALYDEASARLEERAPVVAAYCSFGSEVRLDEFVAYVWSAGGTVAFPCMQRGEGEGRARMVMRLVSREAYTHAMGDAPDEAPFLTKATKAFLPDDERLAAFPVVKANDIDMVAVPLVAFDERGGRLGYGGGNYDEFLAGLRSDAVVSGVAYNEQRVECVPREKHDRMLPRIICA